MTLSRKRFQSVIQFEVHSWGAGILTENDNDLFELYLQLDAVSAGLSRSMDSIRELIFLFEEIDLDNVEYVSGLNKNYSSDIFTTELLRCYRIQSVIRILSIAMDDTLNKAYIFFESKDPNRWGKKLDFYKSKLKTACEKDAYAPMIEQIDELYRVLVKLHFDKNCRKADDIYFCELVCADSQLVQKVYGDNGKYDESMNLSQFYFDFDQTNEVISNYESSRIQKQRV